MPLIPFLTATGFLAAILLVWGQLWVSIYKPSPLPLTVGLGLMWTYSAVLVALVAFALAIWNWLRAEDREHFRVDGFPLGLLVATLIMTGINVGQSIVSVAIKLWRGIPITQSLIDLSSHAVRICGKAFVLSVETVVVAILTIALMIVIFSWLGTKNYWFWIGEIVVIAVLGGIFFSSV